MSFVMVVLFWILCRYLKRKTRKTNKIRAKGKKIEFVESDIKSDAESADESDKNLENENETNESGRQRNNV